MSADISKEKLARRRHELRKRKHSFVELIMQTKKSMYREQLREKARLGSAQPEKAASSCDN
ncbi:MAG: hypothetical protein ACOCVQ_00875 [Bacillota bacterium]